MGELAIEWAREDGELFREPHHHSSDLGISKKQQKTFHRRIILKHTKKVLSKLR